MESQARSDRRGPQRYPTFGAAFAFIDDGEMIELVVRDLSEDGACLHGTGIASLPSRFEAWLPTEGVSGPARIAWRNRHACGIAFESEAALRALKQRVLRWGREGNCTDRMVAILRATKDRMSESPPATTRLGRMLPNDQAIPEASLAATGSDPEDCAPEASLNTKDDSLDRITALVRSRLVKTVVEKGSAPTDADILRKILGDLNLLRRVRASRAIPHPVFGKK